MSPERENSRYRTAAVCLVLIFCLQALLSLPKLSATCDELPHLSSGYSYWLTRDFRINPEHPPLAKLIAAIPLLMIRPKLDTTDEYWWNAIEYPFGFDFLYRNNADQLLFWGRVPMIALAALGAIVTFLWARDLFGPRAGLVALGLYAFSPNLLAHGTLVTTDVPLAVFSTLTLYLFSKQGDQPTLRKSFCAGLALGAAMASKFSGGLLPLLIVVLSALRLWQSSDRKKQAPREIRNLVVMAIASLFVIEASYLFSASPLVYFKNARLVNANHVANYRYYLFGELKEGGWWYYFLVAFAFKATLATLVLMMLAAARAISIPIRGFGEAVLLFGIGFYVLVTSIGAGDLGVRYLLPIFPLVFVWVGRIVPDYWTNRVGRAVVFILVAWQAWAGLSSFPNYIPYFNEMAGGARGGIEILDDSNVDWGQGLKQASEYVRKRGIKDVAIYSFSPFDNPAYYGLPQNGEWRGLLYRGPIPGVHIISAHHLTRLKALDPAWRKYQPVDRIGESLWVYQF
ncbi:MAG TPA: glycosyltransferase family 39 protein [Terriglobia bacterium]|nr:glycosyltransferase family 39 protein [Terriglobia bacterium]